MIILFRRSPIDGLRERSVCVGECRFDRMRVAAHAHRASINACGARGFSGARSRGFRARVLIGLRITTAAAAAAAAAASAAAAAAQKRASAALQQR